MSLLQEITGESFIYHGCLRRGEGGYQMTCGNFNWKWIYKPLQHVFGVQILVQILQKIVLHFECHNFNLQHYSYYVVYALAINLVTWGERKGRRKGRRKEGGGRRSPDDPLEFQLEVELGIVPCHKPTLSRWSTSAEITGCVPHMTTAHLVLLMSMTASQLAWQRQPLQRW